MMIKSVVSRLAVAATVALLVFALPVFFLLSGEGDWLRVNSQANVPTFQPENADLVKTEEEPVVQVASLSLNAKNPVREITDLSGPLKPDTNHHIERASELAKDRKFEEALETLDLIHLSNRNDHGVKFLEARILSWYGKHEQAEQEFENLQAQYPNDLDVLVSYGYLQFYQRNYVKAEQLFVEVLNSNPDYHDARRGLERSRTANNNND